MTEETKVCSKCGVEKPLIDYHYRKDNAKYRNECIMCERKVKKRHYDENSEDIISYQKQYRIENLEKISEQKKQYRKMNIENIKNAQKKYYIENIDKIKRYRIENRGVMNEKRRKYCNLNRDRISKNRKQYLIANREKIREYRNDPEIKIKYRLRSRIRCAVRRQYGKKSYKSIDLLGCSIDYFKQWIQSKFLPGMTWENISKWHIDHIIPCAAFDLTKPEEQLKCFHYTNLQPLWAYDNMSKSDKVYVLTSEGVFFV